VALIDRFQVLIYGIAQIVKPLTEIIDSVVLKPRGQCKRNANRKRDLEERLLPPRPHEIDCTTFGVEGVPEHAERSRATSQDVRITGERDA
jgi:hypothetical protein